MKIFRFFALSAIMTLVYCSNITATNHRLVIQPEETLVFIVKPKEGKSYITKTSYQSMKNGSESVYSYNNIDEYSRWDVITNVRGKPSKIAFAEKGNQMTLHFDEQGNVKMEGFWNGKKINKRNKFEKNVTMENALVARTLDLSSDEKYVFDLIQTSEFPELEAYEMYFQVIGEETIKVPAGEFNCKKVLFSLTGFKGLFYKAYYYITNDHHRYLVKMENMPMGGETELQAIE